FVLYVLTATIVLGVSTAVPAKVFFTFKGELQLATPAGVNPGPQAMALADLNRDGKLDLVVVEPDTASVQVYTGDGSGNFNVGEPGDADDNPVAVIATNINPDSDSLLDLIVVNHDSG